jgi:TatD family hydrolase
MMVLPVPLIDAHCHPDAFSSEEWVAVAQAALRAGVGGCIAAGVWWDDLERLLNTHSSETLPRVPRSEDFSELFGEQIGFRVMPCLGLHPMEIARRWKRAGGSFDPDAAERDAQSFVQTARTQCEYIWAIGETGFDASRECLSGWQSKEQLLEAQDYAFKVCVAIAVELNLPLVLHSRSAWGHTLKRLEQAKAEGLGNFMVHCYPGPGSDLVHLERMGGFASFGGVMSWPNAKRMKEAVRQASPGVYLLETDAPDLGPVLATGDRIVRNEPKYLRSIVGMAAEIRGQSDEEIVRASFANLKRYLFAHH